MSNIPKGATHVLEDMGDTLYYREKGDWFDCWFDGLGWESSGNKRSQLSGLVELNKKPVYTQEMADAGELPKAGMECAFVSTFFTNKTSNKGVCKIIAYYKDKVWCANREFECVINLSAITFKPIDKRTDKEKAADDILKSITSLPTWSDKSKSIVSAIKSGKIHGVKWVGE